MADAFKQLGPPGDPNNPAYAWVSKQTGMKRKRVRDTAVVGGIILAGYLLSKKHRGEPILGGRANQFGMIVRK